MGHARAHAVSPGLLVCLAAPPLDGSPSPSQDFIRESSQQFTNIKARWSLADTRMTNKIGLQVRVRQTFGKDRFRIQPIQAQQLHITESSRKMNLKGARYLAKIIQVRTWNLDNQTCAKVTIRCLKHTATLSAREKTAKRARERLENAKLYSE